MRKPLTVLVFLAALVGFFLLSRARSRPELDGPALLREVRQTGELVSIKYTIQKVIGLKEPKRPFGEESILLVVQARVLGGVDLQQLTEGDVQVSPDRVVRLRLPPPRILEAFIDDKATQVWDRRVTWWTPWVPYSPDLEQRARQAALTEVRTTATEMGLLRDARTQAERVLDRLLRAAGARDVIFVPSSS